MEPVNDEMSGRGLDRVRRTLSNGTVRFLCGR